MANIVLQGNFNIWRHFDKWKCFSSCHNSKHYEFCLEAFTRLFDKLWLVDCIGCIANISEPIALTYREECLVKCSYKFGHFSSEIFFIQPPDLVVRVFFWLSLCVWTLAFLRTVLPSLERISDSTRCWDIPKSRAISFWHIGLFSRSHGQLSQTARFHLSKRVYLRRCGPSWSSRRPAFSNICYHPDYGVVVSSEICTF